MLLIGRAKVFVQGLDVFGDEQGVGNAVLPDCGGNASSMASSDYVNRVAGAKG